MQKPRAIHKPKPAAPGPSEAPKAAFSNFFMHDEPAGDGLPLGQQDEPAPVDATEPPVVAPTSGTSAAVAAVTPFNSISAGRAALSDVHNRPVVAVVDRSNAAHDIPIHANDEATVNAHVRDGGEHIWSIYVVTEAATGRQYVGQTYETMEARWKAHCRPSSGCTKLRDAIQEHGKENFGIKSLVVNIITQEEANEYEKKYMLLLKTMDNIYIYIYMVPLIIHGF